MVAFLKLFSEDGVQQPYNATDPLVCPTCPSDNPTPRTKIDFIEITQASPVVIVSLPRINWNRRNTMQGSIHFLPRLDFGLILTPPSPFADFTIKYRQKLYDLMVSQTKV